MSEITMPALLSGLAGMGNVSADTACDSGAFKEIMCSMMVSEGNVMPTGDTEVTADNNSVLMGIVENSEGLTEDASEELISHEGAAAFIDSLKMFLDPESADEKVSVKEIAELWKNVPDSEKKYFAELLSSVCFEDVDPALPEDASGAEMLRVLTDACAEKLNQARPVRSDDYDDKDTKLSDDIAFMLMHINIPSASYENSDNEAVPSDDTSVTASVSVSGSEKVELPMVEIKENIQNVYNSLETAEDADIKEFCKTLSDELNVQIAVKEKASEVVSEDDSFLRAMTESRQAVMSRIRNAFDTGFEAAAAIAAPAVQMPDTDAARIPDVTEQITGRIDLADVAVTGAEKEITIELAPEELGRLEISIRNTREGLVIAFSAEKTEAAELIGAKAAALAEAVAGKGMELKEMYVSRQIGISESDRSEVFTQSGFSGGGSFGGSQADNNSSEGKHFVFTKDENGDISADVSVIRAGESNTEIYYNREAKLWVSA